MSAPDKTKDMLGRQRLTPVHEALSLLTGNLQNIQRPSERIFLDEALDRITAKDIFSPEDLPAHARSTMDGFAVKAADTFGASQSMPCYLQLSGEVFMGENPLGKVEQGHCFRISTGGLLPVGSDAVVMLEHTIPVDDKMIELVKSVGAGTNLIDKGEDISKGSVALAAGHRIRPQDLGLLAGLGIGEIEVYRQVKVGILSTGDEIVHWSENPPAGKIRDINNITLTGLARRAGAKVIDYGIVSDREEDFFPTMLKAIKNNDIVLFSGGSSVGMRDLGEKIIERLGNPGILVHGVTLKPGKPIIIGLHNDTPLFGLPGHPVSAMVCFELFVEPAIDLLSGHKKDKKLPQPTIKAVLERNINSAAGRLDLVRVRLHEENGVLMAQPVLGKSGSISTLSRAHGYFFIDESSQGLEKNSEVRVHLLQ
ncbi:MAG: molybdopterin molybdotransferase MoeA [Proteobacteria bacterium]|jgi:molybdopterin molybdotransferase|nr:molybdopterin molybdotransferase MoeA [Desulfocapsa sp.]MBU3944374.1 molybdopterin molybdotransferase MoeA [Pseudomonadota bacterium]MCG2743988.1 molybdopterin molybdotransferase MoeA [Desulfobacteraceae bacterium]MBU3983158.1 molybdopterin molybdotransferase MoeA [Pseudomonadota bacterium]MBU4029889.1 molybdopterin molybdotransferase MoeA [Pseudomonadota bacterium]